MEMLILLSSLSTFAAEEYYGTYLKIMLYFCKFHPFLFLFSLAIVNHFIRNQCNFNLKYLGPD